MADRKFSRFLLDPTSAPTIETLKLAERPESLNEKVVAIFVNSKPNSLILMDLLKNRLQTEHHVKAVIWREGDHICRPSPIALIDEISSQVDVAITGTGD